MKRKLYFNYLTQTYIHKHLHIIYCMFSCLIIVLKNNDKKNQLLSILSFVLFFLLIKTTKSNNIFEN